MSQLEVKRTWACALHMSAFDPKRTSADRGLKAFLPRLGVEGDLCLRPVCFPRDSGRVYEEEDRGIEGDRLWRRQ